MRRLQQIKRTTLDSLALPNLQIHGRGFSGFPPFGREEHLRHRGESARAQRRRQTRQPTSLQTQANSDVAEPLPRRSRRKAHPNLTERIRSLLPHLPCIRQSHETHPVHSTDRGGYLRLSQALRRDPSVVRPRWAPAIFRAPLQAPPCDCAWGARFASNRRSPCGRCCL